MRNSNPRRHTLADKLEINSENIGEGTPIVFLHYWSGNLLSEKNLWEPLFDDRPGWQRIYFDLPGHGHTPGPASIVDLDGMLDAIWTHIDEQTGGQPFVLSGTSLSGYLARGILHQHPERILGLAGIVPVAKVSLDQRDRPESSTIISEEAGLKVLADAGLSDYAAAFAAVTEKAMSYVIELEALEVPADMDFLAAIRSDPARFILTFDVDDLAAPFAGPSLFIMGRQDSVVGYRDQWQFIENFPRATFSILDRTGHSAFIEQESLVRQLAGEWLDRVREGLA
jgi:pimeloyl-ACP methyl ester carboxylesterase